MIPTLKKKKGYFFTGKGSPLSIPLLSKSSDKSKILFAWLEPGELAQKIAAPLR